MSVMFNLGCLFTYVSGYLGTSWRMVAWLQLLPTCLFGVSVYFIPNSPFWLVEKGRENEALESLRILQGDEDNPESQLAALVSKRNGKVRGKVGDLLSMKFLRPFLRQDVKC